MSNPTDREEVLINRVVGREDGADDWCELHERANVDTALWSRIADALEDDACLRAGSCKLDSLAASVELPVVRLGDPVLSRVRSFGWRAFDGLGWLAALVVAALWLTGPVPDIEPLINTVVHGAPDSIEQTEGSTSDGVALTSAVLVELPKVLIQSRPTETGDQFEVLYLRRTLERAVVPELYEMRGDETGQLWPVSVTRAALARAESF